MKKEKALEYIRRHDKVISLKLIEEFPVTFKIIFSNKIPEWDIILDNFDTSDILISSFENYIKGNLAKQDVD